MSSAWDNAVAVGAWAPKSLEEYESGPCGKGCRHEESLGNGGDWLGDGSYVVPWECPHGSFLMAQQAPAGWTAAGQSHAVVLEWDSAENAAACFRWLEHRGCLSFGDITFLEDMRYYSTETPEIRAQRKKAEALRDAADEAKVICSKVARKEEKWTNKGSMKFRVPRPCRYASLFEQRICANCSAKLPAGSNTCSAQIIMVEEQERRRDGRMAGTGKMVARLAKPSDSGVRTCGEKLAGCWNHDQHRSCIYVHPDEPQWAAACAGTLDVRADNRLIFCMATDPSSQRLAGQVVQRGQPNRWAALGGGAPQQQRGSAQHSGRW
jgi:predicted nucleic acid-binding Zn ribbon protein